MKSPSETLPVLTIPNPLSKPFSRFSLLESSFRIESLSFPVLLVEVPHQHPGRVYLIESASTLRERALDALEGFQSVDATLAERDVDSFSDAELIDVLAYDLFAMHIVYHPDGLGVLPSLKQLQLHVALDYNFPWRKVKDALHGLSLLADSLTYDSPERP